MSEKKEHIIYTAADIQRYLEGKMSAGEMHALEKAALEDPFLADALEGWSTATPTHGHEKIVQPLDDLHRAFEEKKDNKGGGLFVRMPWLRVAAAVLIVGTGGWIAYQSWFRESPTASSLLAKENVAADTPAPTVPPQHTLTETDSTSVLLPSTPAITEQKVKAGSKPQADLSNRNNKPPEEDKAAEVASSGLSLQSIPADSSHNNVAQDDRMAYAKKEARTMSTPVQPPAAAAPKQNARPEDRSSPQAEVVVVEAPKSMASAGKKPDSSNRAIIYLFGRVTGANNQPLAYATIAAEAYRPHQYTTDQNGFFKIPLYDSVVQVGVSAKGYHTSTFKLRNQVALNQLKLEPAAESLDGKTAADDTRRKSRQHKKVAAEDSVTNKVIEQEAVPTDGWVAYEKYLQEHKQTPPGDPATGEVVVSFQVDRKGKLSGFRIEKPLEPTYDEEAIRLIRTGPGWKLLTGDTTRVTVIVRF